MKRIINGVAYTNLDDIELHQDKIKNLKNVMRLMEEKNFSDAYEGIKKAIYDLRQDQIAAECQSFGWILPR